MGSSGHSTLCSRTKIMGWVSVCLLGVLLTGARMHPLEVEMSDTEDMTEFFVDLFVQDSLDARTGRDLEEELDNEIEEDAGEIIEKAETLESNPEEVARFNNYMDAVFRRMNAALRAKLMDPMELNLNQKTKKEDDKKDNKEKKKKREKRDVDELEEVEEEEEEKTMEESVDRMGTADKKKKMNKDKNKEMKDKKNKKKKGEVKNKNKKKGEKNNNKKKGGKKEKDPKVKAQKQAERQKKREEKRAMKKKEKDARKSGELSREQRSKQSKEKHEKNGKKKDRKEKKNPKETGTKNKARENKKSEEEAKSMGSLSGIATLRRSGDVSVEDDETHKVVTSVFTVGPLQLEVSKSLGHGKARTVKTAKATTDVMTGVMVLKVKPDGSAHVKKVVFKKPEHVDVTGSISDKKERSQNILKNSFNRSRPLAAQKILKTARYVLKGSSNANRS